MATATKTRSINTVPRLKALYNGEIVKQLEKDLELKNINDVPKLEKIVINVGLGKAKDEKKLMDIAVNTLRKITGQQPVETTSRMSIATFKLREGSKIGCMVTLRGDRMYEFLDRLITLVLPRLRDFHGTPSRASDQQGNYSLGLREQSVFPELTFEETTTLHGLQVNIVINSKSKEHSEALLRAFGMPFDKTTDKETK